MNDAQIVFDNAELLRAIDGAIELLSRPRALMEEMGAKLESSAQLRFETKVDPAGVPWPALSPVTVNYWYKKKYPKGIPGSLLERTRQLRNSLAYNVGDDYVDLGTSRRVPGKSQPYWEVGQLHEWGTTIMPRRGILTADPETGALAASDEADLLAIIERAMLDAFD
jgi:phage virion morphogenesis protein